MAERLVGLVMLVVSGLYLSQALRMPVGSAARPGPAFYPQVSPSSAPAA